MAAVFIPAFLCQVQLGYFTDSFLTMATAIVLSGVVALTLTGTLCHDVEIHEHLERKFTKF
jgi:HAE1 family hydrophobic/amphiphilic exporter-1